jgi:hypothetical protein
MNKTKLLFVIILILLLINIIISEKTLYKTKGEIEKIDYFENNIRIKMKFNQNNYILFTNKILKFSENDKIIIYGIKSNYKNEEQIIVNKIKRI